MSIFAALLHPRSLNWEHGATTKVLIISCYTLQSLNITGGRQFGLGHIEKDRAK